MHRILEALGSGVVVYAVVTACSGGSGGGHERESADPDAAVLADADSRHDAARSGAGGSETAGGASGAGGAQAGGGGGGGVVGDSGPESGPAAGGSISEPDAAPDSGGLDGCPTGEKRCRGYCIEATPANGCLMLGCEPCDAPTGTNEVAACDGPICGSVCADGFHRDTAGDCVPIRVGCRAGTDCDATEKPCGDVCCLRDTAHGCSLDATCEPCPAPTSSVGTSACTAVGFCTFACPPGYDIGATGCEPI